MILLWSQKGTAKGLSGHQSSCARDQVIPNRHFLLQIARVLDYTIQASSCTYSFGWPHFPSPICIHHHILEIASALVVSKTSKVFFLFSGEFCFRAFVGIMGAEEAKKDTSEVATEDQAQEKSVIPLPDPVDKVSRSKTSANVESTLFLSFPSLSSFRLIIFSVAKHIIRSFWMNAKYAFQNNIWDILIRVPFFHTLNMSKYFFICTEATDNPNEKNSGATAERGKYKSSLNLLSLFIDWIHKKTTDFNFGSWDAVLAAIETEKRLALIKAWEESEKSKAENR